MTLPAQHTPAPDDALQRAIQLQLASESSLLLTRVTALARSGGAHLSRLSCSLGVLGRCNPAYRLAPPPAQLVRAAAAGVRQHLLPLAATATRIHALIGSPCLADQAWRQQADTVTLLSLAEQLRRVTPIPADPQDVRCLELMLENLATARRSASVIDGVIGEALSALRAAQDWDGA